MDDILPRNEISCQSEELISTEGKLHPSSVCRNAEITSEYDYEKEDTSPENIRKVDDGIDLHHTDIQSLKESSTSEITPYSSAASTPHNENANSNIQFSKENSVTYDVNNSATNNSHNYSPITLSEDTNTKTSVRKLSCAFTIDHFVDEEQDANVQAAKYKNMIERFQSRHRRGASMSKLETDNQKQSCSRPPKYQKSTRPPINEVDIETATQTPLKAKFCRRDRSISRTHETNKRHSWSPQSTSHENNFQQQSQQFSNSYRRRQASVLKGDSNLMANHTQFIPRSSMQVPLRDMNVNVHPETILDDFDELKIHMNTNVMKKANNGTFKNTNEDNENDLVDDISDTGTYTLDGDNYTEEQKDLMNIDKESYSKPVNDNHLAMKRIPNILELNYCYDEPEIKNEHNEQRINCVISDQDYKKVHTDVLIEKIKTHVLSKIVSNYNTSVVLDPKFWQSKLSPETSAKQHLYNDDKKITADIGSFTSVTTSGILAKQSFLAYPKQRHQNGLSTSQIDTAEYLSDEMKSKKETAMQTALGYTDQEKAIRLGECSNQKQTEQPYYRHLHENLYENSESNREEKDLLELTGIQTAHNKYAWIKEWARNARARNLAKERLVSSANIKYKANSVLMTQCTSGDCIYNNHIENNPNNHNYQSEVIVNRNRMLDTGPEIEYTSDRSMSTSSLCTKPPRSPSKIPSPLHSLSRTRGTSRARSCSQNNFASDEDGYLHQILTTTNTIQQNISPKNSLQSPTHSVSSRTTSSAIEYSPQHNFMTQRQNVRQTIPCMMTRSINEKQLQQILQRQLQSRKESFDDHLGNEECLNGINSQVQIKTNDDSKCSDHSPQHGENLTSPTESLTFSNNEYISQNNALLSRSRSFSARMALNYKNERSNKYNKYAPPKAYPNNIPNNPCDIIKKSSSSNNFEQVYDNDYKYFINCEDDSGDINKNNIDEYFLSNCAINSEMANEYYRHFEHDNLGVDKIVGENHKSNRSLPLTNTRYNKSLLMRIERSKKKLSEKTPSSQTLKLGKSISNADGGLKACPNTPEISRRFVRSASARTGSSSSNLFSSCQSMPRDTSLNRLAQQQVPSSLASAKRQLLHSAVSVQRSSSSQSQVQPRYLDISKFKLSQNNQFLRKNDLHINTLKSASKSAETSIKCTSNRKTTNLNKSDPVSTNIRSVRSTSVITNGRASDTLSSNRSSSAVRWEVNVSKQKKMELEMWKRRSKYDPLKSAAEDRKKKEEAKRLSQFQQEIVNNKPTLNESNDSSLDNEQSWLIDTLEDFNEADDENIFENVREVEKFERFA